MLNEDLSPFSRPIKHGFLISGRDAIANQIGHSFTTIANQIGYSIDRNN